MSKVTDCARALGEAIVASEEYKNMQVTEQAAMSDPTVAELMARYMELKQALGDAMCQPDADPEVISRYGQEMDEIQQTLNNMPSIDAMTSSRKAFSAMMNQVINDPHYYPKDIDNYDDSVEYVREICIKRAEFIEARMESYAKVFNYKVN